MDAMSEKHDSRTRDALPRGRHPPGFGKAAALGLACLAASLSKANGQLDPAEMQRQVQQQMGGGSCGGGGGASPNRIGQLASAAGAGGAAIARSARQHPRAAIASTAATATAVWVGVESQRSGVLVCRSPRTSLFRPSDKYLSWVLEMAADAPIASPLRGVILSPIPGPDAEEEAEEGELPIQKVAGSRKGMSKKVGRRGGAKTRRTVGSGEKRRSSASSTGEAVGEGVGAAEIQKVLGRTRDVEGAGSYMDEERHGKGRVKSVCAGVRVGTGLGLYHKFAQGLKNLDVFDGRSDCELMAAETSPEDVGSTLLLLSRSAMGTWSISPLRIVLHRESSLPVPRVELDDGRRRGSHRKGGRTRRSKRKRGGKAKESEEEEEEEQASFHLQYTLALSAVEGAGWSGTWVFRVTYNAQTEDVWFQTSLAQRKGAFGTTAGGDQVARVKRVNEDMLKRGNKHAAVLRTRAEQFTRVSALARSRARDAKELERDRVLNPDKYKRVHRYMRDDSHTTGGASARPARWGEERRRNDIRLK